PRLGRGAHRVRARPACGRARARGGRRRRAVARRARALKDGPVLGERSSMLSRPLRILMISTEVESFARTGGLGDVVESLSRTFAVMGAEVVVVTPLYGITKVPPRTVPWDAPVLVRVGWGPSDVRSCAVLEVDEDVRAHGDLRICLLDDPPLFGLR